MGFCVKDSPYASERTFSVIFIEQVKFANSEEDTKHVSEIV